MASFRHDSMKKEQIFNRLFILGGRDLTEDDWRKEFSSFGRIIKIYSTKDHDTGRSKGVTYISYSKTSECCKAVEEMNGKYIDGIDKSIKVIIASERNAKPKGAVEENSMLKKLFIMFPKDQTEDDIRNVFKEYGDIEYIRIVKAKRQVPRALAYIKYGKQSDAARAYEECDRDYKAIFADIKTGDELREDDRFNKDIAGFRDDRYSDRFSDSRGSYDFDSRGSRGGRFDSFDDRYSGRGGFRSEPRMGFDDRRLDDRPMDMGVAPLEVIKDQRRGGLLGGSTTVEVSVSGRVSENHVKRLCDLLPGLISYKCDPHSGIAFAEYTSASCAAYAQEKLNSFEYPIGFPLSVKLQTNATMGGLGDAAAQINSSLQGMTAGNLKDGGVQALVESITRATAVLQQSGLAGALGSGLGAGQETVAYCNVPLPYKKPFAPRDATCEQRLFIVSQAAFPDRYLEEGFCRFGDLISAYFMPGKGFGYAKFASKDSANEAIRVLHGQQLCGNRLKVMEAEPLRYEQEDGYKSKRMRESFD